MLQRYKYKHHYKVPINTLLMEKRTTIYFKYPEVFYHQIDKYFVIKFLRTGITSIVIYCYTSYYKGYMKMIWIISSTYSNSFNYFSTTAY